MDGMLFLHAAAKGFLEKAERKPLTGPTEAQQKNRTSFAPHIIIEIHPPRSVWLWGAVLFFCGAVQ
ncbi:hypothetical protein EDM56_28995 [Brevibacillus fluminis]|uniref:Uncharacterized protein n=1 Tax=Brevibacillus fluminis TaxID=511487 RepID=A0A3M8CV04_9BACL|nr:hypothetical protein EDM56_28995 [Brevibacillus fluminis]